MYQSLLGLSRDFADFHTDQCRATRLHNFSAYFEEPFVLIRGVIDHEVHHELHVTLFKFRNELIHILNRAERWIDLFVVRDVVAIVGHWRFVDYTVSAYTHGRLTRKCTH